MTRAKASIVMYGGGAERRKSFLPPLFLLLCGVGCTKGLSVPRSLASFLSRLLLVKAEPTCWPQIPVAVGRMAVKVGLFGGLVISVSLGYILGNYAAVLIADNGTHLPKKRVSQRLHGLTKRLGQLPHKIL